MKAVLDVLQPKLAGSEGSGRPRPCLGRILPCREDAAVGFWDQLTRSVRKYSVPCYTHLSILHKKVYSKAPCEDKSAFDFLNHFLMCMSFGTDWVLV